MPLPKKIKQKKCKNCRELFLPARVLQTVCRMECAVEFAEKQRLKKSQKELRKAKEKAKTKRDYTKEAQIAFNAFIRARDAELPCISCVRHHTGQYHAGHYMPTSTRPSLRFNEMNVHKQCSSCNTHLHGNIVNYRIALLKKIGPDNVAWLEGNHDPVKYTIEDLKEIKKTYSRLAKELRSKSKHTIIIAKRSSVKEN